MPDADARLAALERSNRRLRFGLLALALLAPLPYLLALSPAPPAEVRASRFVLVTETGETAGYWMSSPDRSSQLMMTGTGPRDGSEGVTLSAIPGSTGLIVGKEIVLATTPDGSPQLAMSHPGRLEYPQVLIGVNDGGMSPGVIVQDAGGRSRSGLLPRGVVTTPNPTFE